MKSARGFGLAIAILLSAAGLLLGARGWAQEEAARLRLSALTQEGDLLLEEALALEPATRQLEQLGGELAAQGKQLEPEVAALERLLREYNAEVVALATRSAAQREQCTAAGLAAQQIRDCNDEAANIAAAALGLEQRRPDLDRGQQELNQRIDRHNTRRLEWDKARREQDGRRAVNESDIREWLQRARAFWSTDEFAALSRAASTPAACSPARLSGVSGTAYPVEGLKRMQACLKAVSA
jgi:chromosome segregation ATPase